MPIQTFMTVIAQDDHLTAGAWAACDQTNILMKTDKGGFSPAVIRSRLEQKNPVTEMSSSMRLCFVFYGEI